MQKKWTQQIFGRNKLLNSKSQVFGRMLSIVFPKLYTLYSLRWKTASSILFTSGIFLLLQSFASVTIGWKNACDTLWRNKHKLISLERMYTDRRVQENGKKIAIRSVTISIYLWGYFWIDSNPHWFPAYCWNKELTKNVAHINKLSII